MHAHVCRHVHVEVRGQSNVYFFMCNSPFFYELGVHHWHGNHHVAIVPSESQGHACLFLPTSGTTSMLPIYLFLLV